MRVLSPCFLKKIMLHALHNDGHGNGKDIVPVNCSDSLLPSVVDNSNNRNISDGPRNVGNSNANTGNVRGSGTGFGDNHLSLGTSGRFFNFSIFNNGLDLDGYVQKDNMDPFIRQQLMLMEPQGSSGMYDTHPSLLYVYTICTALVILLGVFGNSACLKLAIHRRLIRQPSSQYFFVFCLSDLLVLIFYVLPEWLERGLYAITHIPIFRLSAIQGLCQLFLFTSYWLRFLSIWLLVMYSIERFINLHYPFIRKRTCNKWTNTTNIITLAVITTLLTLWKTISSAVISTGNNDKFLCTSQSNMEVQNLIYDSIYAALISVIPSLFILVFNIAIARHLFIWRRSREDRCLSHQELVGFQFAGLLVLIAFCFLVLTWPYYICWIHDWWVHYSILTKLQTGNFTQFQSQLTSWKMSSSLKLVTRTVFYSHFGINFFLYSFTSRYFRVELKRLFTLRSMRRKAREYYTDDYLVENGLGGQCRVFEMEYEMPKVKFAMEQLSLHTI